MRRFARGAIFVALGTLGSMGVLAAPGCQGRQCDFGPIPIYGGSQSGELVAPDAWESNPIDADWLDFNAKSGWNLVVDRWIAEGRPIVEMHAYVSQMKHPNCIGNAGCSGDQNFTEGSGNIAEFSHAGPGNVWVYNDTCAQYYVRVTLRAGPPTVDAGHD